MSPVRDAIWREVRLTARCVGFYGSIALAAWLLSVWIRSSFV